MSSSGASAEYRRDIDGIRAVAITSVVGFHVAPLNLHGGFVGVDIFFVLSGFLISGIIYSALSRGTFSYIEFYARRARRIFPALAVVLLATLTWGYFNLLPDEFRELGLQALAGAGFSANILFWREAGYFDAESAVKPLLHLWSLGVEEQFYLFWPLILAVLVRSKLPLMRLLTVLGVASLAATVIVTPLAPAAAFFLPFTRFWELLAGSALACYAINRPVGSLATLMCVPARSSQTRPEMRWIAEATSVAALALFLLSLCLIRGTSEFPGWWALLPVGASIAMLLARHSWFNRTILSSRVLVALGRISYPLYLWHWVLLAWLHHAERVDQVDFGAPGRLAAAMCAVALAWLTNVLVERPIRFGRLRSPKPITLTAALAGIGAIAGVVIVSDGAAIRYPLEIRPLATYNFLAERDRNQAAYRMGRCFLMEAHTFSDLSPECFGDSEDDESLPLIVLWGDSHAASLYPGLLALKRSVGGFRLAQFTSSACPPILGLEVLYRRDCPKFNDGVLGLIRARHPQVVIMEANWWMYSPEAGASDLNEARLGATLEAVKAAGAKRVVVFGNLPVWTINQPRVVMRLWQDSGLIAERTTQFLHIETQTADRFVRRAVDRAGLDFFSPLDMLCNDDGCLLTADGNVSAPLDWDNSHLTSEGSRFLVKLAANAILETQIDGVGVEQQCQHRAAWAPAWPAPAAQSGRCCDRAAAVVDHCIGASRREVNETVCR